jgi:hypothetical protein
MAGVRSLFPERGSLRVGPCLAVPVDNSRRHLSDDVSTDGHKMARLDPRKCLLH